VKYVPPYGVTANPDASYVNGDPSIGRQGSIPPAAVFENPKREIVNLIGNAGQSPADADLQQLTRGVRDGKLNFCVDSGPLNELEVQLPGPALQSYTAGLVLNVLIAHTNTGPTRISIGTLNPTTVKRPDGSELAANDLLAGMVATMICDGTYFQLVNVGTGETGGPISQQIIDIPYVHDTGIANHLIGLYSPPLADIREGRTVEIKLAANVTGATDFKPNNFPIHNVVHPDGSPLNMGDGLIGQIWLLVFDGTNWQLLGVMWTAGAPTVPAEPKVTTGKSLAFDYRGFNQSSCLRRTPPLNGNRQVWTISMFVKRRDLNPNAQPYPTQAWFSAGGGEAGSDYTGMYFTDYAYNYTPCFYLWWNSSYPPVAAPGGPGFSNPTFEDINWHHFLMNSDGANIRAYTDGILMAQGAATGNGAINAARPHLIGSDADDLGQYYGCNVKMAEIYQVDGLCVTWDKFANNVGGVMLPKRWSGAFGINGCYLNWDNSSAATETTLGKDQSGNNNNWLPFNIPITNVSTDYPG
jgi:hypothetical protein